MPPTIENVKGPVFEVTVISPVPLENAEPSEDFTPNATSVDRHATIAPATASPEYVFSLSFFVNPAFLLPDVNLNGRNVKVFVIVSTDSIE